MVRLEARYVAEGKREVFEALRDEALETGADTVGGGAGERTGSGKMNTAGAAEGLSAGPRRVAVHRLRKRFAEALRAVVADTLPEGGDVDAELRELGAALREGGA